MRLAGILLLAGVVACAPQTSTTTDPKVVIRDGGERPIEMVYSSRPDSIATHLPALLESVWNALPAAYSEVGIEVTDINESAREMGNRALKFRRFLGKVPAGRYLDCPGSAGGTPMVESADITMSVLTRVRRSSNQMTDIATSISAMARPVAMSGNPVPCHSTGNLERAIERALKNRVVLR